MEKFEPSLLGKAVNVILDRPDAGILEVFANKSPNRDYWVTLDFPHFTSLCPVTGQPDFARIVIRYIPEKLVVETKSLKFYLQSYRNFQAFNEQVVNRIADDLVQVLAPKNMKIEAEFASRGGISLSVSITYPQE